MGILKDLMNRLKRKPIPTAEEVRPAIIDIFEEMKRQLRDSSPVDNGSITLRPGGIANHIKIEFNNRTSSTLKAPEKEVSPDALLNKALGDLKKRWLSCERPEEKPESTANQLTHSEKMERLDRRIYGLEEPPTKFVYRFIDGEAHRVEGSTCTQAAAYEFDRVFQEKSAEVPDAIEKRKALYGKSKT